MTDPRDTTKANQAANEQFHRKSETPARRPDQARSTQEANEAANAEFHDDKTDGEIGDNVGGLRGSPD